MKENGSERLHLIVPSGTRDRINRLRERTGLPNLTMVIRSSLALLDFVSEEEASGAEIILRQKDGTEKQVRLIGL